MVVEEPQGVLDRELESQPGSGRPDRCGQRHQEVIAELARIALTNDVVRDGGAQVAAVESPACCGKEAGDLGKQTHEATVGEGPRLGPE